MMSDTEAEPPFQYTIEGLLERFGLLGSAALNLAEAGRVRVSGRVGKVRPARDGAFLDLESGSYSLTVKIPDGPPPNVGDPILVQGVIRLQPARFHSGLEVLLIGHVIGATEEPGGEISSVDLTPFASLPKIPMRVFLDSNQPSNLTAIGSEIGLNDLTQALLKAGVESSPLQRRLSVADKSALKRALEKSKGALAIVRGGDDGGLTHFDDPEIVAAMRKGEGPVYTALGHAHRVTLADKYADESFLTPTDLGASIARDIDLLEKMARLKRYEREGGPPDARISFGRLGVWGAIIALIITMLYVAAGL